MHGTYFRTSIGETIYNQKYSHDGRYTWPELARVLVDDVCWRLTNGDKDKLVELITDMKFIPGGRYLYYAGRKSKAFNNCYLLKGEEDTREEWGRLLMRASDCLMSGGGIGVDYSVFRHRGAKLERTGGQSSGPIPLMHSINEVGRNVMQGGSRRSAIYASLNWRHKDAPDFLAMKDWHKMRIGSQMTEDFAPYTFWHAKQQDFNFAAPLDMTNVSLNYDDAWLYKEHREQDDTFLANVRQAMMTGEPGFAFNFGAKENETLRNACTEVVSEDDSDVCNLGSINMGRIDSLQEFREVVRLATMFLACGTTVAHLPYEKVYKVREKNRRLGLGLMGVHEWLLKRGYGYEVVPELHLWLQAYKGDSDKTANRFCDQHSLSRPVANRAIAPTGTIGLIAGYFVACLLRD